MLKRFLFSGVFLLSLCLSLQALEVPALTGRVNDYASLLTAPERTQLENFLADYEAKTSNQLVLLTISSLQGDSLEGFSIRVVEKWKLGQKNKNNGLLMLVSKEDRSIRIEVGYGLEGKITDAFSGYVIREIIVPAFRGGSFYGGIYTGFDAITKKIADEFTADENPVTGEIGNKLAEYWIVILVVTVMLGTFLQLFESKKHSWRPGFAGMVVLPLLALLFFGPGAAVVLFIALLLGFPYGFIAILIAQIFWALASSSGGSRGGSSGWSSGGSFGGGFSGGGGSFGGGGSSGRW